MRFEYKQEFWQIYLLNNNRVCIIEGKLGTLGHKKILQLNSFEQANQYYRQEVAKKQAQNWIETNELPNFKRLPSHPILEKHLADNITQKEAWLMYGDWLQTQNDIRGELIALEYAQENKQVKKASLVLMEQKYAWMEEELAKFFLYANESKNILIDNIQDYMNFLWAFEWERGFVKTIILQPVSITEAFYPKQEFLIKLFQSPITKFLQNLAIKIRRETSGIHYLERFMKVFMESIQFPTSLNTLYIYIEGNPLPEALIKSIFEHFPHLEEVVFQARTLYMIPFHSQRLKSLSLRSHAIPRNIENLQNAWLPHLEEFAFSVGSAAIENYRFLSNFFNTTACPKLTELSIKYSIYTNVLVTNLLNSALLKQLKILDLSYGNLDDQGARILMHEAFQHLELLNIENNQLSRSMKRELMDYFGKSKIKV